MGQRNAVVDAAALRTVANRFDHAAQLIDGAVRAHFGSLAFDGATAVGWCELAPRADLDWLAHGRYFRPVDELPVWSVPCFYVRRTHRRHGVMGGLIGAAVGVAASAGAPALEAYPVDTAVPGHTRNLFLGVASVFAQHGFEVVARRQPDRPIMRKVLGAAT